MKSRTLWMGMMVGAGLVAAGAALAATSGIETTGRAISIRTLERNQNGEFLQPVALIANNRNQWDKLMKDLEESGQLLLSPARSGEELARQHGFDWKNVSVMLVSLGQTAAAGEEIEVKRVLGKGGTSLEVEVSVRGLAGLTVQSMSSPYHLIVVEHADWRGGKLEYSIEGAAQAMGPSDLLVDSSEPGVIRISSLGTIKGEYR